MPFSLLVFGVSHQKYDLQWKKYSEICSKPKLGGYPTCEVGLIMYNPNPSQGRSIHYINWTNNMDQFLALLPFLSFKGHNLNHTAAEGLAEALGMFPRERMTEKEYFECERHCVLVPTGEPVAERMLVPLPRVHDGKFIHGQIRILLANFLDVAKMFVPLRISLSVITPTLHPLFVSIFNEGNSLDKSTPIMDYGNGHITVLLSNNFKEAKNVHYSKGIESMKTTTSIPINFSNTHQGDQYSANSMNIGQPSIQGFQNVRRVSIKLLWRFPSCLCWFITYFV
ncbi:mediator of RNA polymerase II transcription subunit 25-like [Vigna unguiculata]|uniref:mediator of RNA polymerase II transcription subunit 25-like n=1 Tax=Vigna unguiculata TaxID=3917 RepID=UPI001016CD7E|nr:mediator of RNA polymerase II transcription subunit 25-like [Vigna unguiculata]